MGEQRIEMMKGILYIAQGEPARRQAKYSIESLRASGNSALPICIIGANSIDMIGVKYIYFDDSEDDKGARWAKVCMDTLTPFDYTLYMDADTRIAGNLSPLFKILADGWEMTIAPSPNQGDQLLWHVSQEDKHNTIVMYGSAEILQLQGGVIAWRKCAATQQFFAAWRAEWLLHHGQDQAALLRAIWREPCKLWLLGRDWNGGSIVQHMWGMARREK